MAKRGGVFSALAVGGRAGDACGVKRLAQFLRTGLAATALGVAGAQADPSGAEQESWPLRGEVRGEVKIAAVADLALGWRVEAGAEGLRLSAARPGVELELALRMESGGGWRWTVRRGAFDVAELWPLVRGKLGAAAAGWSASGRIELAGEGTWTSAVGPKGELRVELREGWARSDELEAEVSGVELDVKTKDLVGGTLGAGQKLRVGRITLGALALQGVLAEFGISAGGELVVSDLEAQIFGGRVKIDPFSVSVLEPVVAATARVEKLAVAELVKLSPGAVADGQGRLGGSVMIRWNSVAGLVFEEGRLTIDKKDLTTLRLAPLPGFLTSKLPRVFSWLSPALASDLRKIEMGRTPLAVESLQVVFNPDGNDGYRTAQINLLGRPTGKSSVQSVRLEVNLAGDLTRVLMLGMSEGVELKF